MDSNLNEIPTCWTDIRLANEGSPEQARIALEILLKRYEQAIRRYLLGAMRDVDAADEVYQNFATRLISGGFRCADPARGRFRDLVRTSLARMVTDYHRARQRSTPADHLARPVADLREPDDEDDQRFQEVWLWNFLERAWDRLAQYENQTRKPLHAILRIRTEQPRLNSAGLAAALGERLGQTFTVVAARRLLHDARIRYVAGFVIEVEQSLDNPTADELESELQWLGMLDRCRDYLRNRRK